MAEMTFYIKAMGLCVDENGVPDYGGIKLKIGEYKQGMEQPYSELINGKDPKVILNKLVSDIMDGFNLSDIQFITPEEYERDYGYDDDE